jgi:hypothetical protein
VNVAAAIAALQAFVSEHPTGGAACMLRPQSDASITRNDIRAIARIEVRNDEVIIFMGEPIPGKPPNTRISAAQLLQQLTALPDEAAKQSLVISDSPQKVDEHHSIEYHSPVLNTGVVQGPNEELFLLAGPRS